MLPNEIGQVYYVDPSLPGEPMTFRDVFLHSEALEGMVLSMVRQRQIHFVLLLLFDSVALQ